MTTQSDDHRSGHIPDPDGFSLIEILLVITILGILAAVVVVSVGSVHDDAARSACAADKRQLITATESYFAQSDTAALADAGGPDGYELTLVQADVLRQTSEYFDLDAAGQVVQATGSPCAV